MTQMMLTACLLWGLELRLICDYWLSGLDRLAAKQGWVVGCRPWVGFLLVEGPTTALADSLDPFQATSCCTGCIPHTCTYARTYIHPCAHAYTRKCTCTHNKKWTKTNKHIDAHTCMNRQANANINGCELHSCLKDYHLFIPDMPQHSCPPHHAKSRIKNGHPLILIFHKIFRSSTTSFFVFLRRASVSKGS